MSDEQMWALGCTGCGQEIKMPVSWFKQAGNACPHCSQPVDSARMEKMMAEVKKSLAHLKMDDNEDIEFNF